MCGCLVALAAFLSPRFAIFLIWLFSDRMSIAFGSFWYKARLEERVMHDAFGAEYDAYRREVKSLIPFVL